MSSTRLLSSLVALCLLCTPAFAYECTQAQEVSVPCSGVLITKASALEAIELKRVLLPLCNAQKDQLYAQLRMARFDLDQSRLSATRGWYEHPVLWVVVGAVAASAALLVASR